MTAPLIGELTPVKAAIGRWLTQFHAQYQPSTPATAEWASRQSHKAMAFAPARMVDQAEEMLKSWRRNDNAGAPSTSAYLPTLIAAIALDYTATPGEHGRPLLDYLPITFPDDTKNRSFRVRLMHGDLRAQVLVAAGDALSAMSIIAQLDHWCSARPVMYAPYEFAGFTSQWPVKLLQADRLAINSPLGEQLAMLALDLIFRVSLPMFKGPTDDEPNDGESPPGYPVVQAVDSGHDMHLGPPTGVSAEEWAWFTSRVKWADGPPQVGLSPLGG